MKTACLLLSAALLACESTATAHDTKHLRIHEAMPEATTSYAAVNTDSTRVAIGHQCAYDPALVASLYPCAEDGVCVRTSPTFGKCFTKEEAAKLQANAARSVDDDEDDDEDDDSSDSDDEAAVADGKVTRRTGDRAIDDDENDEEEDDDDDQENKAVPTKPLVAKKH